MDDDNEGEGQEQAEIDDENNWGVVNRFAEELPPEIMNIIGRQYLIWLAKDFRKVNGRDITLGEMRQELRDINQAMLNLTFSQTNDWERKDKELVAMDKDRQDIIKKTKTAIHHTRMRKRMLFGDGVGAESWD